MQLSNIDHQLGLFPVLDTIDIISPFFWQRGTVGVMPSGVQDSVLLEPGTKLGSANFQAIALASLILLQIFFA